MDEELLKLRYLQYKGMSTLERELAILVQLETLNATLLKLADNLTECTFVYRGKGVVRTDQI